MWKAMSVPPKDLPELPEPLPQFVSHRYHLRGGEDEDHTKGQHDHKPLPLIDLESQQLSDFPNEAGAGPLKANSDTVAVLENRVYGVADDHLVVVDSCLRSSKFMYACGSIYCLSLFCFVDFDL